MGYAGLMFGILAVISVIGLIARIVGGAGQIATAAKEIKTSKDSAEIRCAELERQKKLDEAEAERQRKLDEEQAEIRRKRAEADERIRERQERHRLELEAERAKDEAVSVNTECKMCGAALSGHRRERVRCPYCDFEQTL